MSENRIDFVTALDINLKDLKRRFESLAPDRDFDSFLQAIKNSIDQSDSTDALHSQWDIDLIAFRGADCVLIPIKRSIAYCLEAQNYFRKGNSDKAWYLFSQAKYHTGYLYGLRTDTSNFKEYLSQQALSQRGADARSNLYEKAKSKMRDLLKSECPEEGWGRPASVIKTIAPEMATFIRKNSIPLREEILFTRLMVWLKSIEKTRTLYFSLMSEKQKQIEHFR